MARIIRNKRYKQVIQEMRRNTQRLVDETANAVRNEAIRLVSQRDSQVEGPSLPGQPPGTDSSHLRNNINISNVNAPLTRDVESGADYSAYLEFGTRDMAARPFMQPAADEGRRFIRRNARGTLKTKVRRAR